MNLKQIWCEIKTLGKHIGNCDERCIEHYCMNCGYYLYSDYDMEASRKEMRNSAKMWWQEKE